MQINKVAVIGAGTMGSGIAGQVANAGIEVWLLDLPTEDNPNALAERGLQRLRDPDQPGLISADAEQHIHLGNTRDDFSQLADCDWVAEAVVERLDIKKDLYQRLHAVCPPHTIITSNTSTIPIRLLVEDMPLDFRRRFAITHFFNPVRFMRLLELVSGEDTDAAIMQVLADFCDQQLGKGVVPCRDTPGFLGNRVGVFAIQCALHTAFAMGLSPQEADAVFGRPLGIPKTGVFGLYDLIGIDLMSDVAASLKQILPPQDAFHRYAEPIALMTQMIANGQTGNKQGQGFYRTSGSGEREVLDLAAGGYVPAERPAIAIAEQAEANGMIHLLTDDSRYGHYAWQVISETLCYAASLIPEVGDDPLGIDDAMKLGYNWIKGPFEMLDEIGVDYMIQRLQQENRPVPPFLQQSLGSSFYHVADSQLQVRAHGGGWHPVHRPNGVIRFSETRRTLTARNENAVASWFELEDLALVEFHSKANALDGDSMAILADALDAVEQQNLAGLIVHNDAQHFSCGVNLQTVRRYFQAEDMDGLDQFLQQFQRTVHRMQTAEFPVIAAPVGLSIGGGFEVVLHTQQVICHANSTMGLVESLVGLVPAGGGCKETLYRWVEQLGKQDDISQASWKAFMNLGYGKTAASPVIAQSMAMLRQNDSYLNNRDRLLSAAIAAAKNGADCRPFARPALSMPGAMVFNEMRTWLEQAQQQGKLYPHDVVVGTELARIVSGGDIEAGTLWSEQDLYDAERRSFLHLVSTAATRARIDSMLDRGISIRN